MITASLPTVCVNVTCLLQCELGLSRSVLLLPCDYLSLSLLQPVVFLFIPPDFSSEGILSSLFLLQVLIRYIFFYISEASKKSFKMFLSSVNKTSSILFLVPRLTPYTISFPDTEYKSSISKYNPLLACDSDFFHIQYFPC